MNLVEVSVMHNKYGAGIIKHVEKNVMEILFEDGITRKFMYPDAFKKTMSFVSQANQRAFELEQHIASDTKNETDSILGTNSCSDEPAQGYSMEIEDFNRCYTPLINAEISFLKIHGGKHIQLYDGKRIHISGGAQQPYVYSFEGDSELNYPSDTQLSVWTSATAKISYPGTVISCESFTIIFSTSVNLGEDIPTVEISSEPWMLMRALTERMADLQKYPARIAKQLIKDGPASITRLGTINQSQSKAIAMARNQPITFIWGPPGTGKTETLSEIATRCVRAGERVLMLSYSNVSVDEAVLRVKKKMPNSVPGLVLRYGYSRKDEVANDEYLSSYNLVIHNHPLLKLRRDELLKARDKVTRDTKEYAELSKKIESIRKQLKEEESKLVQHASFVATTVSKAVIDTTVYDETYDTVIFDEASMAFVPQIVFAAGLARSHFVCMGDFCQLPPIVQSTEAEKLSEDIFDYCGISEAVKNGRGHNWLCLLDTQHRMHSNIASLASRYMYNGLMKTATDVDESVATITDSISEFAHAVGQIDLSGTLSVCQKTRDGSRINVLSAMVCIAMAIKISEKNTVSIISPYSAQSRLLRAMARDIHTAYPENKEIKCATVHQFQGSENDVVLYDPVDCWRMQFPGLLLTNTKYNTANRLFNVAMTRAKGKFISVENNQYLSGSRLPQNMMFARYLRATNNSQDRKTIDQLSQLTQTGVFSCFVRERQKNQEFTDYFINQFITDIKNAKKEVRIDVPTPIAAMPVSVNERIIGELKALRDRGKTVYVRTDNRDKITNQWLGLSLIENQFICNPVVIIDNKIVWYGMPFSDTSFITAEGTIYTRNFPVFRIAGKFTAKSLYGFLEMNHTNDRSGNLDTAGDNFAAYVMQHKKCSKCSNPLKLIKTKNGKFLLGCSNYPNCQYTEFVDVDFVEQYFFRKGKNNCQSCPQCKMSLEAKKGPYGVYVQCCGHSRHKYKLDQI